MIHIMTSAGLKQSSCSGWAEQAFDSPLEFRLTGCANNACTVIICACPGCIRAVHSVQPRTGECGVRGPREDPTILDRHRQELGVMAAHREKIEIDHKVL